MDREFKARSTGKRTQLITMVDLFGPFTRISLKNFHISFLVSVVPAENQSTGAKDNAATNWLFSLSHRILLSAGYAAERQKGERTDHQGSGFRLAGPAITADVALLSESTPALNVLYWSQSGALCTFSKF